MDNKLRIQRVKEGIELLEKGIDPADEWSSEWVIIDTELREYLGLSEKGLDILYVNSPCSEGLKIGFVYGNCFDITSMLHNWKRFLELIEKNKVGLKQKRKMKLEERINEFTTSFDRNNTEQYYLKTGINFIMDMGLLGKFTDWVRIYCEFVGEENEGAYCIYPTGARLYPYTSNELSRFWIENVLDL